MHAGALTVLVLLVACGTPTPPPGNGDNPPPGNGNNPPPDPNACTVVIDSNITIPSRLINSANACDYFVTGDIWVQSELTIDPGVVVVFDQDARLLITDAGSLSAVGTPDARIVLAGQLNVRGYWYGLCFGNNRESRLEYVDLLWAGKVWSGGSTVCRAAIGGVNRGAPVHIRHSVIAGSLTNGLDATRVPIGEFENNVFAANTEYGVRASPEVIHKLDVASDYLGISVDAPNGKPFIHISGLGTPDVAGEDEVAIWRNLNADYYLEDDFPYGRNIIVTGGQIGIEPGTRFVAASPRSDINFWDGTLLVAVGTPDAPIVFTGARETAGSWRGLSFSDSAGMFEHVEVRYGGSASGIYNGNIVVYGNPELFTTVRNSLIMGSETCGILDNALGGSAIRQMDNTFSDNQWDLCGVEE
jgi:hypothetical protein